MICKQLLIILFLSFISVKAQEFDTWRKIIPLQSTRADVEKILGAPKAGETDFYETDKEIVEILYSRGRCKESKLNTYDVPKNTVIWFLISFKEIVNVSVFTNGMTQKFERVKSPETEGAFYYSSKDGSIKFYTRLLPNGIEDLKYIIIGPSETYNYLLCKKTKKSG